MKNPAQSNSAPLLPLDLWAADAQVLRSVPARLRPWLTEEGLLTARIARAAGEPAGVRVIDQRLGFLTRDQQLLVQAPATSCLVREVVLTAQGRPWVFAHTLIPDYTLEAYPWLAELGETALGSTLAAVPGLDRGRFEFAPLPLAHPLGAAALAHSTTATDSVWGRRSWFAMQGKRLLVHEIFLPGIIA